jgi:hypothetical protein
MGNPPYNPPKTETGSSGNSIWQQFVIKSFYMVKEKGFLTFIHPPGWKKPTDEIFDPQKMDILGGEYYKYDKKTGKQSIKQIRQGQVWQVLKDNGIFSFIYTNDQKNKKIKEYIPYFPAVDYYIYQKKGIHSMCNTKNIFLGETKESTVVRLNYELNYLPNLITNQTQDILHKITTKEGNKANFKAGFDPRGFKLKEKGDIKYMYDASVKGVNYSFYNEKIPNVSISKIVLNENGGINSYYCKFIDKSENIGVLHHTLLFPIEKLEGKIIENLFNSDIVKFVFLITQYTSGKMTTNEKLVANSITIPPEDVNDYYAFFDIENYKKYIEDILTHYYKGSNNTIVKEVEDDPQEIENEDKEDELENEQEVEPIKSPIKLDEKIVLVPTKEELQDVSKTIPSPIQKKKTLKKRPKLKLVENSDGNKVVSDNPLEINAEKIFNPLTNRHVKNTSANRKKIEQQTLKRGGKSKKRTRKNKF